MSNEVNKIQAAHNLGITITELNSWLDFGAPVIKGAQARHDRYVTGELLKWRIQYEHENIKANEVSFNEAKRRKELALAQKAELDVAVQRGQLAKIEDLMLEFNEALTKVRAALVSMPARLAGDLSHRSDTEVSKLLEKDITIMLEHLTEYDHENVT